MSLTDLEKKYYAKLRKVRASDGFKLKTPKLLRSHIDVGGEERELILRPYQQKGIAHLLYMRRFVLGDATGLGKTLQAIGTAAAILDKKPQTKYIVVTPTSALFQWAEELEKFTTGLRALVVRSQPMLYCSVCEQNYPKADKAKHHHEQYLYRCEWCNKLAEPGRDREKHADCLQQMEAAKLEPTKVLTQQRTGPDGTPIVIKTPVNGKKYKSWHHITEFMSRAPLYDEFFNDPKAPQFVVMNYHTLVKDWKDILRPKIEEGGITYAVIFDECQAFKNPSTETHKICKDVSLNATRVLGLSATILKNCLMDGYGIYKVIVPNLFKSKTQFMDRFCVTEMQEVRNSQGNTIKVPKIIGYKNLGSFKAKIDPFYLGRAKHHVSQELPTLTTMVQYVEMTPVERRVYKDILKGELEIQGTLTEVNHLTSLIRFQQAVDSISVLGHEGTSGKETELIRMLQESLEGKVVVYSKLSKVVDRLQERCSEAGIETTSITGKVTDPQERQRRRKVFQDPESGVDVIFITDAGSSAINLQAAATFVFYDSPWSYGDFEQLIGRIIRIGSTHTKVVAIHMVAVMDLESVTDPERNPTIDEHVLRILSPKKGLVEAVLGNATPGALEFEGKANPGDIRELYRAVLGL